jgi:nucleotide-binding universal stress UspA family protein
MKILIGYDGSDCAKDAIADLRWAGLPDRVEAEVLSIADVFPHLAPECYHRPAPGDPEDSPIIKRARALAAIALDDARQLAQDGAADVHSHFRGWDVRPNALGDSPHWGLIKRAAQWQPDLIVVGSRGRSAIRRVLLGSVSQNTLAYAPCSVRIGRPRQGRVQGPVRLLIGMDCSPGAGAAVAAVAARQWPARSEAILLTALDTQTSTAILSLFGGALAANAAEHDERQLIVRRVSHAADTLRAAGLAVAIAMREGKPAHELLDAGDRGGADCVFLGARGLSRIERVLLGSVSSAVAARAACSVEVVRTGPSDTR